MTGDLTSSHLGPDTDELSRLIGGVHFDPHSILGPHLHEGAVTIRTLRPWATSVVAVVAAPPRFYSDDAVRTGPGRLLVFALGGGSILEDAFAATGVTIAAS